MARRQRILYDHQITYYMRSIFTLLLIIAIASQQALAQTGIGTTTPDPNAILDITSTTKGFLLPSLSAAQQATLAASLNTGEMGMLVRDAATGKPVYWTGTGWKDASGLTITATAPSISITRFSFWNWMTA